MSPCGSASGVWSMHGVQHKEDAKDTKVGSLITREHMNVKKAKLKKAELQVDLNKSVSWMKAQKQNWSPPTGHLSKL